MIRQKLSREEGRIGEGKSDSFIIKNSFVRHIGNASHCFICLDTKPEIVFIRVKWGG
jgi:hypothetical protein